MRSILIEYEHFNCLRDENLKKSNQFATSFPAQPVVAPVTLAILSAISTLSVAETVQSVETVVVTATRVNQPLSEAASSITVVSEKEIAQTQPLTFAEILDTIPNVDTTSSTSVMYNRVSRKLFKNPCSQDEMNKIVPFGFSLQRQKMVFFCHQNSIILLR